jgi:general secretion pathway protein C
MKRLPWFASFAMFILLCVSIAYWGMQLFQPPLRTVAGVPQAESPALSLEAAKRLFGTRIATSPVSSNYQLKGVLAAARRGKSVAILSADGKPARAVAAGSELAPGVIVREVHPQYVLLSESGIIKRIELAAFKSAGATLPPGAVAPVAISARPTVPVPAAVTGGLSSPLPQADAPAIQLPRAARSD